MKIKQPLLISIFVLIPTILFSQTLLEADGPGDTYELINSVFAPNGGDVVESAECAHPSFGRHIAEVWDQDLEEYVFEFYIHVTPDNDRCINFDRQRVEIKTYELSPDNLKGVSGETVIYKWKFKIPAGFQPSSNFTHIHQVKAVDGDDADPIFVLTARKGDPDKLELNYYSDSDLNSERLTEVNLSLFEGTWVEATEKVKIDNTNGSYSIEIKNIKSGEILLSYSNNKLLTIRADNAFIRPKWGIYRSLNSSSDLRDESIRFNSFSIAEESELSTENLNSDTNSFSIFSDISNNTLKIEYSLNHDVNVSLDIFGINGIHEKTILENVKKKAGIYTETVDVTYLKQGLHFVRLKSEKSLCTEKIIIR